jgi:putative glutamine amidotransferase
MSRPIVVIPCCTKLIDGYTFDAVSRQYSRAVAEVAQCQPLLIPLEGALVDIGAILEVADGILLSGSPSNIEPHHYSDEAPALPDKLDPARDALTLPLVKTALAEKIPLFAICRGFQELNVSLGGALHQEVHAQEGKADHRANYELPLEQRWVPVHEVKLQGALKDWIGRDRIDVNSLHGQGVSRLAKGLVPEAFAPDGLVEAVRIDDHPFLVGVQWHPEWEAKSNPVSQILFRRFGDAARRKAKST